MPRGSRLVARSRSEGHASTSSSASRAAASTRCSQLSRMRSAFFWRRYPAALSVAERLPCTGTPIVLQTVSATSSGSSSGASSAIQTPSGYSSRSAAPTSIARRVLPEPPEPTSVTMRVLREPRSDLRHVSLARHERGHGPRQVVDLGVERAQRRKARRQARRDELIDLLRPGQILEQVLAEIEQARLRRQL